MGRHYRSKPAGPGDHVLLVLKALRTVPVTKSARPATKSARQAAAQRRLRVHPVLLKALCTAPATKSARQAAAAATTRPVLLKALRTAPATKSACTYPHSRFTNSVLCLRRNLQSRFTTRRACHEICTTGSHGPAATTRPPILPEGSVYCACHEICTPGSPRVVRGEIYTPGSPRAAPATKSARQAAAAQQRPRVHPVLLKALCTAPATKSAHQFHQALCLRRNLHSRFTKCWACREICTTGRRPSGDHASTQSS